MRKLLTIVGIVALALLVACAQESTAPASQTSIPAPQAQQLDTTRPGASEENVVQVSIENKQFLPADVTIKSGTSVVWTNNDDDVHTIVGEGFSSLDLRKGDTFERKFDRKGTFAYRCGPHPFMQGTIVVQ